MFRIYKYVKYETVHGDVVTDDCLLGIVETNIGVVDRIDKEMRDYIEKSRYIKNWFDCDYHIETKNENNKWKFDATIECIIDNENRNVTINYPVKYRLDAVEN